MAPGDEPVERRNHCARQAAQLFEAMDVEPIFRSDAGVRALGSVSERAAHRAPCSVLVVPPTRDRQ
jgi:hypothetical protein